jgi:hypothetical protein
LAISPDVIPNETNALSAELNVKNNGNVTVYKSILICALHAPTFNAGEYFDPVPTKIAVH